jgi:hypothetical protein
VAFGDRLLLLTDGVLEAPNAAGELFGRERLAEVLQANSNQPPQVLIPALVAALRGHTNQAPLDHDDVSLLMVEFVDNLKSNALWTAVQNRLLPRRRAKDVFKAARPVAP